MRKFLMVYVFVVVAVVAMMGFRGEKFSKPPIEIFPDMDRQPRYKPQGYTDFFPDGRMDRPVPAGTVAMLPDHLKPVYEDDILFSEDDYLMTGRTEDNEYGTGSPYPVTRELLELGQAKYEIFCTVCHGSTGNGQGAAWVAASQNQSYNMIVTSLLEQRIIDQPDGQIYETIMNGRNLMGAYGYKMRNREMWAVVEYVRALQLAQNATVEDVPPSERGDLGL